MTEEEKNSILINALNDIIKESVHFHPDDLDEYDEGYKDGLLNAHRKALSALSKIA